MQTFRQALKTIGVALYLAAILLGTAYDAASQMMIH